MSLFRRLRSFSRGQGAGERFPVMTYNISRRYCSAFFNPECPGKLRKRMKNGKEANHITDQGQSSGIWVGSIFGMKVSRGQGDVSSSRGKY